MDTPNPFSQGLSQSLLPFPGMESNGKQESREETEEAPIRVCTKCNGSFPATNEFFHRQPGGKYGLKSFCKKCEGAITLAYQRSHTETRNFRRREKAAPAVAERKLLRGERYKTPEKICPVCQESKPREEQYFGRNARNPDGLEKQCKKCRKEKFGARIRKYLSANAERIKERKHQWEKKNPDKMKARYLRKKPWSEANREKRNQQVYARNRLLKEEVFTAYGHKCICCGETDSRFLTIEHIDRDGANHRRLLGGSGVVMYRFLKKNGYPRDRYCLLCGNCNWSTRFGDPCPHQEENPIKTNIPAKGKSYQSVWGAKLKHETFTAYGHKCSCCGEDNARFLTIEHVNKNQWKGKRPWNSKAVGLYALLKKQGWPNDGYTLLCFSCNWVERHGQLCPHKQPTTT